MEKDNFKDEIEAKLKYFAHRILEDKMTITDIKVLAVLSNSLVKSLKE